MIKNEVTPFIYGRQVIEPGDPEHALEWLRQIGRVNWGQIQRVPFGFPTDIHAIRKWLPLSHQGFWTVRVLAGMRQLKTLNLLGLKHTWKLDAVPPRTCEVVGTLSHLCRLH